MPKNYNNACFNAKTLGEKGSEQGILFLNHSAIEREKPQDSPILRNHVAVINRRKTKNITFEWEARGVKAVSQNFFAAVAKKP